MPIIDVKEQKRESNYSENCHLSGFQIGKHQKAVVFTSSS
jgi:hypothetical protein